MRDLESVELHLTVTASAVFVAGIIRGSVRAGNAVMYFPEANVLVPRRADPQSRTPAFKSVLVSIETGVVGEAEGRRRPLALAGP